MRGFGAQFSKSLRILQRASDSSRTEERAPSSIDVIREEETEDGIDDNYDGQYDGRSDPAALTRLCSRVQGRTGGKEGDERTGDDSGDEWEQVCAWLDDHNDTEIAEAVAYQGENGMTPLHLICRADPPVDVALRVIRAAPDALEQQDTFGWLPVHYAAACSISHQVFEALLEEYPFGKTTVDRKGRTPLHFALSSTDVERPVTVELIDSLASTGAATYPDDSGMLVSDQAVLFVPGMTLSNGRLYAVQPVMVLSESQTTTPRRPILTLLILPHLSMTLHRFAARCFHHTWRRIHTYIHTHTHDTSRFITHVHTEDRRKWSGR